MRDGQAPGYGQQKDVFVNGVEALDQLDDDPTLQHPANQDQRRQGQQLRHDVRRQIHAFPIALQQQQHDDGEQILQQQHADDDLAGVAVVQGGGGQEFHPDDGAGEHHHRPDEQGLGRRIAEPVGDEPAQKEKDRRTQQDGPQGLAQHRQQTLGQQVQA